MFNILLCHKVIEKIDRFYVGYTNDLLRRISEHNIPKKKFTDTGIPWKIVYTEVFTSKKEARNRELFIKSKKSKHSIIDLIKSR